MPLHHGQIIEKIIRRYGHSISEVARLVNVNRRSIYNWFNDPTLKPDTIYQIAHVIQHDFSIEFPDLFTPKDFVFETKASFIAERKAELFGAEKDLLYKKKYLNLLKRYNELKEANSDGS